MASSESLELFEQLVRENERLLVAKQILALGETWLDDCVGDPSLLQAARELQYLVNRIIGAKHEPNGIATALGWDYCTCGDVWTPSHAKAMNSE